MVFCSGSVVGEVFDKMSSDDSGSYQGSPGEKLRQGGDSRSAAPGGYLMRSGSLADLASVGELDRQLRACGLQCGHTCSAVLFDAGDARA